VMNFRKDKRGIVGNFMVMFVATIVIIAVLMIFIFGSGLIKRIHKVDVDVSIHDEERTGLNDVFNDALDYEKLSGAKFLVAGGSSLDSALAEVGYEK